MWHPCYCSKIQKKFLVFWCFHAPANYYIIIMRTKSSGKHSGSQEVWKSLVLNSDSSAIYSGLVQESSPMCKNMELLYFKYILYDLISSSCSGCCLQEFLIILLHFHCFPTQTLSERKIIWFIFLNYFLN